MLEFGTAVVFMLIQLFYLDLNASAVERCESVVLGVLATMTGVYLVILSSLAISQGYRMFVKVRKVWSKQTRVKIIGTSS